jgi:1,4-dihydroxy-2-naphthoate octaprenyltransferase
MMKKKAEEKEMNYTTVRKNSLRAWILAARPKTLTGAAVPVLIGGALAYRTLGSDFQWPPFLLCLAFAWLMQIDANFINDWYDFEKGTDRDDRLGPLRACAQGWITPTAMKRGIGVTTLLSCLTGLPLIHYGGWALIGIGMLCVLFAFLYTTRLSYLGWGDLLVLLFFGLVPVSFTYYVECGKFTIELLLASLSCGLVIDALLMINNYRDRDQDRISGKRTLVVRYGERLGSYAYLGVGVLAVALNLHFLITAHYAAALLPLLYLLPHYASWRQLERIHQGKALNSVLGATARNILLYGLLASIGILL